MYVCAEGFGGLVFLYGEGVEEGRRGREGGVSECWDFGLNDEWDIW